LRPQAVRLLTHSVHGARQELFPLAAPVRGLGHLDLSLRLDTHHEHLAAKQWALRQHLVTQVLSHVESCRAGTRGGPVSRTY